MKRLALITLLALGLFAAPAAATVTNYAATATSPTTIHATWTGEPEGDMMIWQPGEWFNTHELFSVPTTAREYTFTGLQPSTTYGSLAAGSATYAEATTPGEREERVYDRLSADKTSVEPTYVPPGTREIHVAYMKTLSGEGCCSYTNLPPTAKSYTPPPGYPVVDMQAWKGTLEEIGGWAGRLQTIPAEEPPPPPPGSMLVGLNAGGWGQGGQEDVASLDPGGPQSVRFENNAAGETSEWTKLGVKSIVDFAGPYNSGGVRALNVSSYVSNVVSTVRAHPDIYAVEILNEPYGQWYWGGEARNTANQEAYGHLVAEVHVALVTNFGTARPLEIASYGDQETNYIQHTPSADYEGVVVHPYPCNSGQACPGGKGEANRAVATAAESYTHKPIYVTEVGWSLAFVSPTEQASGIYTFVNWLRSTGYVADVNIYDWRNNEWGVESHESGYGKRPAWYALREAAKAEPCTVC